MWEDLWIQVRGRNVMSFDAYSDWGAGQPAILGWEEMGVHGITVVCYIF